MDDEERFFSPCSASNEGTSNSYLIAAQGGTATNATSSPHQPTCLFPRVPEQVGKGTVTAEVDESITTQQKKGDNTTLPELTPQAKNFASNFTRFETFFEEGYDSDGNVGPFMDALAEEGDQEAGVDEFIPEAPGATRINIATDGDGAVGANPVGISGVAVDLSDNEIRKMNVNELKRQLKIRGVKIQSRWNKSDLIENLTIAIQKRLKVGAKPPPAKGTGDNMNGFPPGTYWEELKPSEVASEPNNSFASSYAPTNPENFHFVAKQNFNEQIDCPVFNGTFKTPKMARNGRPVMNPGSNLPIWEEKPLGETGRPKDSFLKKWNLTQYSHPADIMAAFIPMKASHYDPEFRFQTPCFDRWTEYTNNKAILAHAGTDDDHIYPEFKPFTPVELRKHMGLIILNGLNVSPSAEMKIQSQSVDPVHGNDFVKRSLGSNGAQRHKHFKAFFGVQNPLINAPTRKTKPNWKVWPLIKQLNCLMPTIWSLGRLLSVDEQTIGFQGKHADKRRITYKAEGDGFQCDALCQDGWTHQVYFRNDPAKRKWISKGLSPLHSRVMSLFECLEHKNHACTMDNLYLSASFCRTALVDADVPVCIMGVARGTSRGVPSSVLQEPVKNNDMKKVALVRGTVKAARLMGDAKCENLIAVSVYDTKPVHFLSTASGSIKWIEKTRQVHNVETGAQETIKFLRLNINNDYNFWMNGADVADQLRNVYRLDHWARFRKWWWAVFVWWLGIMLVNGYILHKALCLLYNVPEKLRLSHHDFRKQVALAWLNPDEFWPKENSGSLSSNNMPKQHQSSSGGKRKLDAVETRTSAKKKPMNRYVNDAALNAKGCLFMRLDQGQIHMPVPVDNAGAKCQLHRWATNGQNQHTKNLAFCEVCRVTICISCWKPFHTDDQLMEKKRELELKFMGEKRPDERRGAKRK